MCHSEGPCEDGAGLSVLSLAVAEEERVGGGIPVPEFAGLAHEAAGQEGIALDLTAGAEDEVLGTHSAANYHRCELVRVDAAVVQAHGSVDICAVPHRHIGDHSAVADAHVLSDSANGGASAVRIGPGEGGDLAVQAAAMAVHCHDVCGVRAQIIGHHNLAAAGLVEHRHLHSVAEGGFSLNRQHVHVVHQGIVANLIVGDVFSGLADKHTVTQRHVMQECIADAVSKGYAAGEGMVALERAQPDAAREGDVDYPVGI